MGIDWRPKLERRVGDGWQPLWQPILPDYWYERILANGLAIGELLSFSSDPDIAYAAFEDHLKSLSHEKIMEVYGDDPRVIWLWREASYDHNPVFKQRDYDWFSAIAGVCGRDQFITPAPFPDDASAMVRASYEQEHGDAHAAGCLTVIDILNCEKLQSFEQLKWLKENVGDPDNTRLIFWFC